MGDLKIITFLWTWIAKTTVVITITHLSNKYVDEFNLVIYAIYFIED